MERINYKQAFIRRWWIVAGMGLIGLIVGILVPVGPAKASTQAWSTTAVVGTVPSSGAGGSKSALQSGVALTQVAFYAGNAKIIKEAAKAVGVHANLSQLEKDVTTITPREKRGVPGVVKLSAVAATPAQSAAFTNKFADLLGAYLLQSVKQSQQGPLLQAQAKVSEIQSQINALGAKTTVAQQKEAASLQIQLAGATAALSRLTSVKPFTGYSVLQPAQANGAVRVHKSRSPIKSNRFTYAVGGLLVGLVIGAGILLAVESLDRTLHTKGRAEEDFGFRVVAEIPSGSSIDLATDNVTTHQSNKVVDAARSVRNEAYQRLRMSMLLEGVAQSGSSAQLFPVPSQRRIVLVVSAGIEPSRSDVVINLAAMCADAGEKVLVINALELHSMGEMSSSRFDESSTSAELSEWVEPSRLENVSVLSLSRVIGSSGRLLSLAPHVMNAARELSDLVIVEAPPLLAFHDGNALASCADVVLVVAECGVTTSDQARRTGELLRRIGAPVLGVVLTAANVSTKDVRQAQRAAAADRIQLESKDLSHTAGRTSDAESVDVGH